MLATDFADLDQDGPQSFLEIAHLETLLQRLGMADAMQRKTAALQFVTDHDCDAQLRITKIAFFHTVREGKFHEWLAKVQAQLEKDPKPMMPLSANMAGYLFFVICSGSGNG